MKTTAKVFLVFVMFTIANGFQRLGAANMFKATILQQNNTTLAQQQDSLSQPGNKARPKAYPPANPGQPRPDRINPAGSGTPPVTPTDTSHRQQAPQRHKAKLAGEQSKPQ